MKALSLWQPWASLIAIGVKPEETRSWSAPAWLIGQRIAIHAAKKPLRESVEGCSYSNLTALRLSIERARMKWDDLPRGKVICTGVLRACTQVHLLQLLPDGSGGFAFERDGHATPINPYGDFSVGRWLWHLADVEQVEPFDAVGRQGIFDLDGPAASRTAPLFGGGA